MQYDEQNGKDSQWQLQIGKERVGDEDELLSVQIKT